MSINYSDILLGNESDVEQKFIYKLLTTPAPNGLGFDVDDFVTKPNIKKLKLEKGVQGKLYFPDYAIIIDGIPIAIIEAKSPGQLGDAYTEARLYASEINASYPSKINPCELVIVTDGNELHVGQWDSNTAQLTLNKDNFQVTDELFDQLLRLVSKSKLKERSLEVLSRIKKSTRYFKPKHMLGGKNVINETVGENSFGSNVSVEYKHLFNPISSDERRKIVENAYVTSKRKLSHVAPIEKIVKYSIPGQ